MTCRVSGGSAANVVKGVAGLAGGSSTALQVQAAFVGMLGRDQAGAEYRGKLEGAGVDTSLLLESSSCGATTAVCLCLVTPDGQRTMRTYLGAALELASPGQLPAAAAAAALAAGRPALLHAEGYCLYRPGVAAAAMRAARGAGAAVSLDLASFEVVRGCWGALEALLDQRLVDLVFCNEDEAAALCAAAGVQLPGTSARHGGAAPGAAAAAGEQSPAAAAAAASAAGEEGQLVEAEEEQQEQQQGQQH